MLMYHDDDDDEHFWESDSHRCENVNNFPKILVNFFFCTNFTCTTTRRKRRRGKRKTTREEIDRWPSSLFWFCVHFSQAFFRTAVWFRARWWWSYRGVARCIRLFSREQRNLIHQRLSGRRGKEYRKSKEKKERRSLIKLCVSPVAWLHSRSLLFLFYTIHLVLLH